MPDRYINKSELAAIFGSSWKAANEQLFKVGVRPIDLGPGRKRGKRWLESAVIEAVKNIHNNAQPQDKSKLHVRRQERHIGVENMTLNELSAYVTGPSPVAPKSAIQ